MTENKQFGNVGNLGDILKHAALTSLVKLLHAPGRRLVSVDTHAFQLEAPCRNPAQWLAETQRECAQHPALESYIELQSRVGETPSRYRCSSGLVLDVWLGLGHDPPALILAESDADSRTRLKKQLKAAQVEPHAVLDDAKELPAVTPPDADVMYALVDPFVLDRLLWDPISKGLAHLAQSVKHAVVEVFTFDSTKDPIEWPVAPPGFKGPIATMHRPPYHLTTYATEGIAEDCERACAELGWTVEQADDDITVEKSGVTIQVTGFRTLRDIDNRRLHGAITQAVARLDDDATASLLHQRRFVERVVHLAAQHCGLDLTFAGDAAAAIRALELRLRLNHHLVRSLHWVRQRGNEAAHSLDTTFDSEVACEGLRHCYDVSRWFEAQFGDGDLKEEKFDLKVVRDETPTPRQLRREETQRRQIESFDRITRQQKMEIQELRKLLRQRSGGMPLTAVRDTVPDDKLPRWVYFATPTKANRSETYELAYSRGVVCSDAKNANGSLKPNVRKLCPADLMLLAYGKDGVYEPQLYLTVEPTKEPISGTAVLHELPNDMTTELERAGYSRDPSLGVFTGFRVTPSSDWKGQIPERIRKPDGQNFLRTWEEVVKKNDWDKP